MLDVIHYLFEEDMSYDSREQYENRNSVREYVYPNLYNTPFVYSNKKKDFSSTEDYNSEPFDDQGNYIAPDISNVTKPFIPATDFDPNSEDPFAGVLRERPLG